MSIRVIGVCGRKGSGKNAVGNVLTLEYGFVQVALADPIKQLAHRVFGFDARVLYGPSACREELTPGASTQVWWARVYENLRAPDVERDFQRLFAAPARVLAAFQQMCRVTFEPLGGFLTARVVLQKMGTELGRSIQPDVWVDEVLRTVAKLDDGYDYNPMQGPIKPQRGLGHPIHQGVVITDVRFDNEVSAIQDYAHGGTIWTIDAEKRLPPQVLNEHASEPSFVQQAAWANRILDNNETLEALTTKVHHAAETLGLQKCAELEDQVGEGRV